MSCKVTKMLDKQKRQDIISEVYFIKLISFYTTLAVLHLFSFPCRVSAAAGMDHG